MPPIHRLGCADAGLVEPHAQVKMQVPRRPDVPEFAEACRRHRDSGSDVWHLRTICLENRTEILKSSAVAHFQLAPLHVRQVILHFLPLF